VLLSTAKVKGQACLGKVHNTTNPFVSQDKKLKL